MIRKLLLAFIILTVAVSSLGAFVPALTGDRECAGACCRITHRKKPAARITRLCCMSDCNKPAEHQRQSIGLLRQEGNKNLSASIDNPLTSSFSPLSRSEYHSPGSFFRSTPVYLRTGSLLI